MLKKKSSLVQFAGKNIIDKHYASCHIHISCKLFQCLTLTSIPLMVLMRMYELKFFGEMHYYRSLFKLNLGCLACTQIFQFITGMKYISLSC